VLVLFDRNRNRSIAQPESVSKFRCRMPCGIKLICTDFDGTLVSHASEPVFDQDCMQLIRDLQQGGALWAINTGRSVGLLEEGLEDFAFPLRPDFVLTSERDVFRPTALGWEPFGDWNDRCAQAHAELYLNASSILAEVVEFIDRAKATEPKFHYQRNTVYLRFCHADYHKGAVLEELSRLTEIPHAAIFAAGDHHNDLSMLDGRYAALPACPANAIDEVKEAVRHAGGCVAEKEFGAGVHEALRYFLS
jgi:hydroxymethylpyrimidine pyrophosphatase-like HAD family hydrolase